MIPVYDDLLTAEDWAKVIATPTSADARRDMEELIDWFLRRYPTPLERLAYVRRRMKAERARHNR